MSVEIVPLPDYNTDVNDYFLAVVDEVPAGFFVVRLSDNFLYRVWVEPEFRSRGVLGTFLNYLVELTPGVNWTITSGLPMSALLWSQHNEFFSVPDPENVRTLSLEETQVKTEAAHQKFQELAEFWTAR